jgi:hypothetical protein
LYYKKIITIFVKKIMAKAQVELESVKLELNLIKTLMSINGLPCGNIEQVVIQCVKMAGIATVYMSEADVMEAFNMSKKIK